MKVQQGPVIMGQDAAFIKDEGKKKALKKMIVLSGVSDFSGANLNFFMSLKGDLIYKLRNQ